jgi:hypothetical protein
MKHKTISKMQIKRNNNITQLKNQIVVKDRSNINGVNIGSEWKYIIIKKYDEELWNVIHEYLTKLGRTIPNDYIKLAFKKTSTNILYRMFLRVRYIGHYPTQTYIKFHEKEMIHSVENRYSNTPKTVTITEIPDPTGFIEKLGLMLEKHNIKF